MSYEPTTWKSGDIVTSAKLNKLEQGVANAGGCLVVHVTTTEVDGDTVYTCDKTAGEMYSAAQNGVVVFAPVTIDGEAVTGILQYAGYDDRLYSYTFSGPLIGYAAESSEAYPSYTSGGK